jgi:hypothetical protein
LEECLLLNQVPGRFYGPYAFRLESILALILLGFIVVAIIKPNKMYCEEDVWCCDHEMLFCICKYRIV